MMKDNEQMKGEKQMTHETLTDEVRLISAMDRNKLTVEEAVQAMDTFANDKQFQKDLDETYRNMIVDDWDLWHEGDIK